MYNIDVQNVCFGLKSKISKTWLQKCQPKGFPAEKMATEANLQCEIFNIQAVSNVKSSVAMCLFRCILFGKHVSLQQEPRVDAEDEEAEGEQAAATWEHSMAKQGRKLLM